MPHSNTMSLVRNMNRIEKKTTHYVSTTTLASSISIYGHVDITSKFGTPISTYTLDDSPSTTFTAPQTTESQPLNNVLFFSATNLTSEEHTLTARRVSTDGATYCFDFIQILPNDNSTISDPPTPPSSSSNATVTPLASPNTAVRNTDSKKRAIAGVICGVIIVFTILLTIFLIARRRRRYRGAQVIYAFPKEIMRDPDTGKVYSTLSHMRHFVHSQHPGGKHFLTRPQQNNADYSTNVPPTDPAHFRPKATLSTNSDDSQSVLIIGNGQRTSDIQVRDTDGGISLAGGPLGATSEEPELLPPEYLSIPRRRHDSN